MSPQGNSKAESYVAAWASSLALLLSRISSAEWRVEANGPAEPSPAVHVRVRASDGIPGLQWFSLSAADAEKLHRLFLGVEVSVGSELDERQREALEELVRQWCGLAATALKQEFGELSLEARVDASPSADAQPTRLLLASDGAQSIGLGMSHDAEQANFLRAPALPAEVTTTTAFDSGPRVEELLRQGNLDLLMDVELPVMLRFGTRQATLREVLDLATGAVLELDREVQEPVDLVLNGKLIARGEVVVVDGNYGLRVTEVASPQQRVNSL